MGFRLELGFTHITGWFGMGVHGDRILKSRFWGSAWIRTAWRYNRQSRCQCPVSLVCPAPGLGFLSLLGQSGSERTNFVAVNYTGLTQTDSEGQRGRISGSSRPLALKQNLGTVEKGGASTSPGRPTVAGAYLVLSESMVWKRPSSSFSFRTPSAKKS